MLFCHLPSLCSVTFFRNTLEMCCMDSLFCHILPFPSCSPLPLPLCQISTFAVSLLALSNLQLNLFSKFHMSLILTFSKNNTIFKMTSSALKYHLSHLQPSVKWNHFILVWIPEADYLPADLNIAIYRRGESPPLAPEGSNNSSPSSCVLLSLT